MTYKCPICGKEFQTIQQVGGHMRTHTKSTSTTHKRRNTSRNTSTAQAQEAITISDAHASQMEPVQASPSTQASMQGSMQGSTQADTEARMQAIVEKGSQASDSDIAWLNTQLDKPVTRQELELAKQKLDAEYAQMQETARQQAEMLRTPPPPPPTYYAPQRETTADKVVNSIDWNSIANNGLNLLAEIIKERRMARSGPSIAEQIGQLAISNFAATLSKEGGRIMGRKLGADGLPEEEYVTKPVLQVMLGKMAEEMEKEQKARQELAEKWENIERSIKEAREKLSTKPTVIPNEVEEAPKPKETPNKETTTQEEPKETNSSEEKPSQEENLATQEHLMAEQQLQQQAEQKSVEDGGSNE